jgi:pimeloyl-ACP methyl ester carboxylesterase
MAIDVERQSAPGQALAPAVGRPRLGGAVRLVLVVILLGVLALVAWLAPVVFSRSAPAGVGTVGTPDMPEGLERAMVNGVELPYLDRGDGPPVLLVHGGGPDMRTLEGVAADLVDDHRVITYNRRGYADAGPVATTWVEHREDAAALLEHLDVTDATVVGFSAGGIPALDLAVERPDLVGALVLVEPAVFGRSHMTPGAARIYLGVQLRRLVLPDEQASAPFFRWVMRHRDGHSVWDQSDYSFERKQLSLQNASAVLADMSNGDGDHIDTEDVRALAAPVTLILGEQSQRWFLGIIETLEGLLPGAERIEIPAVGHAMTFEDPPAVASAVRRGVTTQE